MNVGYFGPGNWGLPEFGLTEMLGGEEDSLERSTARRVMGGEDYSIAPETKDYGVTESVDSFLGSNISKPSETVSSGGGGGGSWGDASSPGDSSSGGSSGGGSSSGGSGGSVGYDADAMAEAHGLSKDWLRQNVEGDDTPERLSNYARELDEMYAGIKGNLQDRLGRLPGRKQEDVGFVQGQYENMLDTLQGSQKAAMDKLGMSRQNVRQRRARTIGELQDDLRNQMKATSLQLGAMGAGSSSAAEVMAPYAFAKMGSRRANDVYRQANEQFSEIDAQEVDVQNTYTTERNALDQWKATKLNDVRNWYNSLEDQIRGAMGQADQAKAQALLNVRAAALDRAQQMADQVKMAALQRQTQLQDWATQRLADLNNAKVSISQNANFNPRDMMYSELVGLGGRGGGAEDYSYLNPYALMMRREDEEFRI